MSRAQILLPCKVRRFTFAFRYLSLMYKRQYQQSSDCKYSSELVYWSVVCCGTNKIRIRCTIDYREFWRMVIGRRTLDSDHLVPRRHFPGRSLLSSGLGS